MIVDERAVIVRSARAANDAAAIDVSGSRPGLGQVFGPERRFVAWHRTMMAELVKKQGPDRGTFHDLFRVQVEGRYRLHLGLVREAHAAIWQELGAMREVILVCACEDALLCHRKTLAIELARAFHGRYAGELQG